MIICLQQITAKFLAIFEFHANNNYVYIFIYFNDFLVAWLA